MKSPRSPGLHGGGAVSQARAMNAAISTTMRTRGFMRAPHWQQPQQVLSVEQQGKGRVPKVTTCGTTVAPNLQRPCRPIGGLTRDRKTVLWIAQGDRTKRGWDHLWDHPVGV